MTKAGHSYLSGTIIIPKATSYNLGNKKKCDKSRCGVREGVWDFDCDNDYNFIPQFEDEEAIEQAEDVQQASDTTHFTITTARRLRLVLKGRATPRTRSLREIHDEIEGLEDLTLFYLFADYEPGSFEEATQSKKWRDVMDEVIKAIEKNNTWEFVILPRSQSYRSQVVYKTKKNSKRGRERYKARLIVKGYSQRAGIDYDEVFAPIAR